MTITKNDELTRSLKGKIIDDILDITLQQAKFASVAMEHTRSKLAQDQLIHSSIDQTSEEILRFTWLQGKRVRQAIKLASSDLELN